MTSTTIAMNSEYHDNFQSAQAVAGKKLGRSVQKSLFDRLDWVSNLHKYCVSEHQPVMFRSSHQEAEAWMYLMKTGIGRFEGLANWYNFTFRPVFTGDFDEVTKLALLAKIAGEARRSAHQINLSPMPEEDQSTSLTQRAFEQAGWTVFRSKADDNHILSVKGRTFDQYWAERPGQLRNTVRRKAKKNRVSTRIETRFSDEHWKDYLHVYANSWKPEEGSPEFLKTLAMQESEAGCLRLGLAYIDGQPVAAQFWTVENGEALIHKLAHLEDATKSSPGTLLTAAIFQHVIDIDHVDLVDFGTGNDPYKRDWMDSVRTRYRLEMYWPNNPVSWFPILKHYLSGLVGRRTSL
ncbi:MAG: GNAT family N-acetyltransferase [Pseudomonadota bacterium]